MAYLTVTQLKRDALPQLLGTTEHDGALREYLDAATAIIDTEVGYSFAPAAVGTRTVYGDGTDYLQPPLFTPGSATVTAPAGYSVPTYIERDGLLVVTRSGIVGRRWWDDDTYYSGWVKGLPYIVSATFGYSATVMDVVQQCCREIAVRLWRFKDAGGSEVIGVEGAGAVQVKNQFSPLVERMLRRIDEASTAPDIGVW